MRLRLLLDGLLDLFFPDRCAGCGGAGGLLCAACRGGLRPYPPDEPPAGTDGATVAFVYDGALRGALHRLKYGRARRVAEPLGALLGEALLAQPQPADALLPVPLHPARLAARGFNQSEALARAAALHCGVPLLTTGLERVRDTGHQAGLDRRARASNIAGAFVWRGAAPPERVLLLDDVLTTGATIAACAAALREAGVREVRACAVARSLAPRARGVAYQEDAKA